MVQLPDYVNEEYLSRLELCEGKGEGGDGARCAIQEVRAWLSLDATTDTVPECVCPVIGRLVIGLNDVSPEYRKLIVPILPRILNTRAELAVTVKRAFAVADWAVRVVAVAALRDANLNEQADTLTKLQAIDSEETARAAAAAAAGYAGYAAGCAAAAAGYAADAVGYAVGYAAGYAAAAAAAGYAGYAAGYAARAVAVSPVAILETLLGIV